MRVAPAPGDELLRIVAEPAWSGLVKTVPRRIWLAARAPDLASRLPNNFGADFLGVLEHHQLVRPPFVMEAGDRNPENVFYFRIDLDKVLGARQGGSLQQEAHGRRIVT